MFLMQKSDRPLEELCSLSRGDTPSSELSLAAATHKYQNNHLLHVGGGNTVKYDLDFEVSLNIFEQCD